MQKAFLTLLLSIFISAVMLPGTIAAAASDTDDYAEISGADRLYSSLPDKTRELLSQAGIYGINADEISGVGMDDIFRIIALAAGENGNAPFGAASACMGIMLLCAAVKGAETAFSGHSLAQVSSAAGALCICTAAVVPVCSLIQRSTEIINGASGFLMLYVPIMTGLLASGGHQAAAGSYYGSLMFTGEVISQISAKLISPLMNVFLALSVTTALSSGLNLSSLCKTVYKCSKWMITLGMSIFVTVLSAQTLVASSLDRVSQRALRFAVGSFVPVVGGVLSETITTFSGSLNLLRSGAGVFVIIASGCLFLPLLMECLLWQLSLSLLSGAADIMDLGRICGIFGTISTVISMLTAVMLCILTIFIISTVIILLIAR